MTAASTHAAYVFDGRMLERVVSYRLKRGLDNRMHFLGGFSEVVVMSLFAKFIVSFDAGHKGACGVIIESKLGGEFFEGVRRR